MHGNKTGMCHLNCQEINDITAIIMSEWLIDTSG